MDYQPNTQSYDLYKSGDRRVNTKYNIEYIIKTRMMNRGDTSRYLLAYLSVFICLVSILIPQRFSKADAMYCQSTICQDEKKGIKLRQLVDSSLQEIERKQRGIFAENVTEELGLGRIFMRIYQGDAISILNYAKLDKLKLSISNSKDAAIGKHFVSITSLDQSSLFPIRLFLDLYFDDQNKVVEVIGIIDSVAL